MPIEFPCEQCRQTLRVPDDAAGKLSRCPKCGHVGRAPGAGTERNPFADGGNPFRETADTTARWDENPYTSPTAPTEYFDGPEPPSELTYNLIRDKVSGPAIALIVMGTVNLLLLACMFFPKPNMPEPGVLGIFPLMMAIKGVIFIAGGLQMKKLKGYGLAMTAAILAVVPCSCCWIAELPIGVWALVVLSDGFVKRAFEQEGWAITDRGRPFPP
jgi:hypothetical protein